MRIRCLWLLLLPLAACESEPQENKTAADPALAVRTAPPQKAAQSSASPAAAALAVAPPAAHALKTVRVGNAALRFDPARNVQVDTIQGRFLQITAPDSLPRLLFRASRRDTVWTELLLEMPDGLTQGASPTQSDIAFSLDNLDQRGQPEVVVTVSQSDVGGNAGREDWRWVNIIDLTPRQPLLLLSAGTAAESEAYVGYQALHGIAMDPSESVSGCRRRISVRQHEVLVGPIKTKGDNPDCSLTNLTPGRYHYQGGQLVWAEK